jgi:hypothetical protein
MADGQLYVDKGLLLKASTAQREAVLAVAANGMYIISRGKN